MHPILHPISQPHNLNFEAVMAPLLLFFPTLLLSFFLYYAIFSRKGGGGGPNSPLPPGPKGWPILGNLTQLGRKPHQTLCRWSKVYGPLFYLCFGSVDVVVAASSAVAEQFLRVHDANFSDRPPNSSAEHMGYNYQDLVFAPYGPRWRMLRKLCFLHLFSPKALNHFAPVRAREVALLSRTLFNHALHSHSTAMVNLGHELTVCTTNTISKVVLGLRVFSSEEEKKGRAAEFKELVVESMRLSGAFIVDDFVPLVRGFDVQGVVGRMKEVHRRFDRFLEEVMEEHRTVVDNDDDLLSVIMRLKEEDGREISDTEIKGLLLNMFIAGTDTSSSTVEWALSEMIRHPDILKKAQTELDAAVGRDRLISESDIPNLPYLQAVIKETFRLHPSTPLSLPHMASKACEVNGYYIPKHVTLLVNVWAIARDPAVWTDPLEFRPTRFLPGGVYENVDVKGNDFEVIPFGAGRRICPGLNLGLRMVQFVTATLVHAFDWVLPQGLEPEKLDMEEAYGVTLQREVPLMVHPVPRLLEKAYEA